jgi:hypothetical protein
MNPSIHPMSSCSQQWVLGFLFWGECGGVAGLQLPNPPSEQLLTMVGGGAHCCRCWHCPGGIHPHCHSLLGSLMAISTHYPPCKQWLTAVVVGAGTFLRCFLLQEVGGQLVMTWHENGLGVLTLWVPHYMGLLAPPWGCPIPKRAPHIQFGWRRG